MCNAHSFSRRSDAADKLSRTQATADNQSKSPSLVVALVRELTRVSDGLERPSYEDQRIARSKKRRNIRPQRSSEAAVAVKATLGCMLLWNSSPDQRLLSNDPKEGGVKCILALGPFLQFP